MRLADAPLGGSDELSATSPDSASTLVVLISSGLWSVARAQFTQQGPKLVATGADSLACQGASVSVSGDGNIAVVGGPCAGSLNGSAWLYTRSGGVWTQQAKLIGTGATGNASQGVSVSLSGDGNTATVGGPADNANTGAAWVFANTGGVWSQQGSKLVGTGAVGTAAQGISVALSGDSGTAVIGGDIDNGETGAAWVFTQPIAPTFAGMPGKANCYGRSVSALAREFGGLSDATAGLGFASVTALENAIIAFCQM